MDRILDDIDSFLPGKLISEIESLFNKKKSIKSSDDDTKCIRIINKMIQNILFVEGNKIINENEKNEYNISKYNHIQKYNKYLYSCLDQHFKN